MIKPLMDFLELEFPITLLSKNEIDSPIDKTDRIVFGDSFVLKNHKSLLDAFNPTYIDIPETLGYCAEPESFLSTLDLVKTNYILDSNFNVFLPQKYLAVEYHTFTLYQDYTSYLRIKEYSYFFKKLLEKDPKNNKPLFAVVNEIAFFIGWNDEPVHIEIRL